MKLKGNVQAPIRKYYDEDIFLYEQLKNNKCRWHNISEILRKFDDKEIEIIIEENK